jgi:hypothetical protein
MHQHLPYLYNAPVALSMKRPRDDRRVRERLPTYLPEEFCELGYIVFSANLAF